MKDPIHELIAVVLTERNVNDFSEEDLLENEGELIKSRLSRGKAEFLGIVDKAYLMTVVKHSKRPNMYILVIYGAELVTKTLNEEIAELEENEISIPIETEEDKEKAKELAEKLEECAITEFKVDEDGDDELLITYTNGNKDKVEEILEECGVEFSDEEDEFDEASSKSTPKSNVAKRKSTSSKDSDKEPDYLDIKTRKAVLQIKKFLDSITKGEDDMSYDGNKKGEFTLYYDSDLFNIEEIIDDIYDIDPNAEFSGSEYSKPRKTVKGGKKTR